MGYAVSYPYWAFPNPYVYGYPYMDRYAYAYPNPYPAPAPAPNPYPYVSPYPPIGSYPSSTGPAPAPGYGVQVQDPNNTQAQYGGLSFQIEPGNAKVLVDNAYVGVAGQFTATSQPMTLAAGRHRIEIQLEGYQTIAFDVNIAPGQVIPYEGRLLPQ
jgi:hypothetical protein